MGWTLKATSLAGILVAVALIGVASSWYLRGGRCYTVQTGSMQPLLHPGDAILTEPVSYERLRVGQIVSYRDKDQPSLITTHRVARVDIKTGTLTTKGDHNTQADLPVGRQQLLGRATMVAPHLGYVIGWLRRPLGLIVAIYVPATLLIGGELVRLYRRTGGVHYQFRTR